MHLVSTVSMKNSTCVHTRPTGETVQQWNVINHFCGLVIAEETGLVLSTNARPAGYCAVIFPSII